MKNYRQTAVKAPSEMIEMFSVLITLLFTLFAKTQILNVFENLPHLPIFPFKSMLLEIRNVDI